MKSEAFDLLDALEAVDGRHDRLQRIIELYFLEKPLRLTEIHAGVQEQDAAAISSAAHRLAGTLVYLKAAPALSAARRMDDLAVTGDLNSVIQAVAALEAELVCLDIALSPYREKTERPS